MKRIILPLLLFFVVKTECQVNLNTGLMAYYPFNGNANDVSGNNNNPVFNSATLTADRTGTPNSAYAFNGSSSYMRIANSPSLNFSTQMSISAWVRVDGFYNGTCHGNSIVMKGDADYLSGNYLLRFDDGGYTNFQNCANPVPDVAHQNFYGVNTSIPAGGYTPFIQTGQWYHVIYTCDGVTGKLYANCQLKSSAPASGATFTNTYDLFFGKLNSALYPYWFNGALDEIRIYNRALTTDEVNVLGGCSTVSACLPTFQKKYGSNKSDIGYSTAVSADGSFAVAGYTNSFGAGGYDGYLQKMDKNGVVIWSKTFGGTGNDYFYNIKQTSDGGYIMLGNTGSYGGGTNGVTWLVKTDATGNLQWARKYDDGNANGSLGWDVTPTSDGGYAICGMNRYSAGLANGMVIKTDNTGAVVWAKSFDSGNSDQTLGITEDGTALVITSLQYGQSLSFYDAVITKLNRADGSVVWSRSYEIEGKSNWPQKIFKTTTGYGFSVYDDNSFSASSPEEVIVNTDVNGNALSVRKVTGSPVRSGNYLPTSDGGFIVAQGEVLNTNDDIHLVKVSSGGAVQWTKRFGGTGLQSAIDIASSPDGGFILTGYNNGTPAVSDSADIYIIKTDSLGSTPGCTQGATTATVTNPAFSVNAGFTWSSVTNISFGTTAVTPSVSSPSPVTNTLCLTTCQLPDTIINAYTPVLSLDKCKNVINVEDGTKFNVGDTVLLIQMKGAVIDSSNTAAFGTVTNYRNAGSYEFNYVKSKAGSLIELKNVMTRKYDIPDGKVQLVRVPYFQNARLNARITCLPWDGSKGGIVVLNAADTIELFADIDVQGKGFRGGGGVITGQLVTNCASNNYNYPVSSLNAAQKGESITTISNNIISGKGAPASGGGGGLDHNSGGGGGGNGGTGGFGGYQLENCGNAPFNNRGIGGNGLVYSAAFNRIFLGGGGGAGHANNPGNTPPSGGNGGGIVIVMGNKLKSNGFKIIANGEVGASCQVGPSPDCHDGMGGGGAGGTVLLNVQQYISNSVVETKGAKGTDMVGPVSAGRIGPGGGGAGGVLFVNSATLPAQVTNTNSGGINGVITTDANNPWGATPGAAGATVFNLTVPVDQVPYKATFDSSKLHIDVLSCTSFRFAGLDNTDTTKIVKWQWSLGDGTIDSVQQFIHEYLKPGVYPVKLVATDIYGCVATFVVDLEVHCRCEKIRITSANPAIDYITIGGLGCGVNTLILYNMLGQKLKVVSGDHPSETIYVSQLPKAMYMIRVINSSNVIVANLKVMKM